MLTLSAILSLLVTIAILLVVFYLLYWIISILPFPPPFEVARTLLYVLLAVFGIMVLLDFTGLFGGTHLHVVKF